MPPREIGWGRWISALTAYDNGIQKGTTTPTAANVSVDTLEVGGRGGIGSFAGSLAEQVLLSTAASTALQAQVEGYLAQKFALQGNLDGAHAHKIAPPAVALATY